MPASGRGPPRGVLSRAVSVHRAGSSPGSSPGGPAASEYEAGPPGKVRGEPGWRSSRAVAARDSERSPPSRWSAWLCCWVLGLSRWMTASTSCANASSRARAEVQNPRAARCLGPAWAASKPSEPATASACGSGKGATTHGWEAGMSSQRSYSGGGAARNPRLLRSCKLREPRLRPPAESASNNGSAEISSSTVTWPPGSKEKSRKKVCSASWPARRWSKSLYSRE